MSSLHIYPTYKCNLRCMHCIQNSPELMKDFKTLETPFHKVLKNIELYGNKYKTVFFSGGEPTVYPLKYLLEIIRKCKEKDLKVFFSTNAMKLSNWKYCYWLFDAGVDRFAISFYGYRDTYEYVTQVKDSWNILIKGIDNCYKIREKYFQNKEIELKILLIQPTIKHLEELIMLIAKKWPKIDYLLLVTPSISETFKKHIKNLGIKMSETVPYIKNAIKLAEKLGLGKVLKFLHFPPCIIGEEYIKYVMPENLDPLIKNSPLGTSRSFMDIGLPEKCKECKYYMNRCTGFRLTYLKYYGDEEFKPIKR